ncbi:MAG: Rid family detoxifying hydrolase [Candidatus Krumholzibacteria bacterium]|nr:Rid family detoxifying hydrolase [Candidatus Krumholzibacteria bacterium]MCK5618756.1 Rid family detoxifying hydrolase [Candidatus Krumholzibacteria bacterium]
MTRRTIQTNSAPAAIGPYSQGVAASGLVFTSMQIGLDPATGNVVGATAPEQVRRCLQNVKAIVEAAGGSLANVVKVTVYMTDIQEFAAVNEVYAEFFTDDLPARAVVEVAALPKGALIAAEAVAIVA